jgi:hypothetical protein
MLIFRPSRPLCFSNIRFCDFSKLAIVFQHPEDDLFLFLAATEIHKNINLKTIKIKLFKKSKLNSFFQDLFKTKTWFQMVKNDSWLLVATLS